MYEYGLVSIGSHTGFWLKSEFEAVLTISADEVKKKMDKALGRLNLADEQ